MRREEALQRGAALLLTFVAGCFCRSPGNAEYDDYDSELAAWRLGSDEPNGCYQYIRMIGECNGGKVLFLHEVPLDSSRTIFFEADSGQFLGREDTGSCLDLSCVFFCQGHWYYPRPIQCQEGVVTEVLCGTHYQVGDAFP